MVNLTTDSTLFYNTQDSSALSSAQQTATTASPLQSFEDQLAQYTQEAPSTSANSWWQAGSSLFQAGQTMYPDHQIVSGPEEVADSSISAAATTAEPSSQNFVTATTISQHAASTVAQTTVSAEVRPSLAATLAAASSNTSALSNTSTSSNTSASSSNTSPSSNTQAAASSSATTSATASAATTASTTPTLSPAYAPVVGTEGMIFNPSYNTFGGLGAQTITDNDMWSDPFTGKSVSADLVIDGYESLYGGDTAKIEEAIDGRWGQNNLQDYESRIPQTAENMAANPMQAGSDTLFQQYGAWNTFTDPTTGNQVYFDALGKEYASGTGPAMQEFSVLGTPGAGWYSTTAA